MYNDYVNVNELGFLLTVAKLYDEGYSVAEIARKSGEEFNEVNDAVINICMARESYRQSKL